MRAEQLELFRLIAPWGGVAPRALTKGAKVLFFRQAPQKTPDIFDPAQGDLFRGWPKGPSQYEGAPLLIERR